MPCSQGSVALIKAVMHDHDSRRSSDWLNMTMTVDGVHACAVSSLACMSSLAFGGRVSLHVLLLGCSTSFTVVTAETIECNGAHVATHVGGPVSVCFVCRPGVLRCQ
jgi:hypothetical protein